MCNNIGRSFIWQQSGRQKKKKKTLRKYIHVAEGAE